MMKQKKKDNSNLAITVKQPFATLICEGVFSHINTNYDTKHRGRILIHAAETVEKQYQATVAQMQSIKDRKFNYPTSAIIGEAELYDVVLNHPSIWSIGKKQWLLKNVKIYKKPIINITGRPLLWKFSE